MTDTPPRFGPPDDYEPPPSQPFVLHGRRLTDGEPWEETFSILGEAPQGAMADLSNAVTIERGTITYGAAPVVRFLRSVIVPADELRFNEVVRDKDRPIPVEQLGAVMLWAAGYVAGRPTGPSSSSGPGQQGDGAGSEDEQPGADDRPTG